MPDTTVIRDPARQHRPLQRVGQFLARLIGWRVAGELPEVPKFVAVVFPHTSNWDLPIGLICAHAIGLLAEFPFGFMVKDSAMGWPVIGPLVRWWGGIAIDRSARYNAVDQMAEVFRQRESLMLAITPEGTRKKAPYLKSGFYYIALKAGVPLVPTFLDYRRRLGCLGPVMWPTGDVEADLQTLREFFADVVPLYPDKVSEFRFKPTDAAR
jgi:1-acyl-sn-glycerol-3-phosphate acyltransferase